MRKPRITLFVLTAALLLGLTACKQVSPATEPPEPRVTVFDGREYIVVEPRFTIDTIPECGNTKKYIDLLYLSREAVEEALSVTMEYRYHYDILEQETLWDRDFFVTLDFGSFNDELNEHLMYITYSFKVPRDMIQSETEHIYAALVDLYGEPDLSDSRDSEPPTSTGDSDYVTEQWTLDKNHPASSQTVFPEKMRLVEGVGLFLEFRNDTLNTLRPEDMDDRKTSRFISLIYKLAPYVPVLRYAD